VRVVALLLLSSSACVADLDSFVNNPRHCSLVGPETCADQPNRDRRFCTPCDEPYPWDDFGMPGDAVVDVEVALSDGETNVAHFVPSSGARPDLTILYGHGNFGGVEHYLNRIGLLYETGANLFVVEYRGYGKSSDTNEPTEEQTYDDAVRTRDALDGIEDAGAIMLYGFSVGTFSILEMAVRRPTCGLFLEAPIASAQQFADKSTKVGLPSSFVTTGVYDNVAKIPALDAPLLVVHGTADDFIPIEDGEALFAAAPEPKEFVPVPGAGHGNHGFDVPTALGKAAYLDLVTGFASSSGCVD
jgi:uncharacterized protein